MYVNYDKINLNIMLQIIWRLKQFCYTNNNVLLLFFRVRNWALKFGVDLWEFGRQFTKMNDIKNVSIPNIIFV